MKKWIISLVVFIGIFLGGCDLIEVEFTSDSSDSYMSSSFDDSSENKDLNLDEDSEDLSDVDESNPLDYEGIKSSLSKGKIPSYVIKVTIDRVVDGDTMKLRLENGDSIRIRTLLIDTPEDTKEKQYLGDKATSFAKSQLKEGSVAYIETDGPMQDKYDRYLGYLWYKKDGEMKMYNEEVLKQGLARVAYIKEGVRHLDVLSDAEYEAKDKQLNVWSIKNYVTKRGFDQSVVK